MSSPKKPKPDYEYMEEQLKLWETDIEKWYENEMSSETARLAASGIEKGSDLWEKSIADVESKYQERLSEMQGSSAFKMVELWKFQKTVMAQASEIGLGPSTGRDRLSSGDVNSSNADTLTDIVNEASASTISNMGYRLPTRPLFEFSGP